MNDRIIFRVYGKDTKKHYTKVVPNDMETAERGLYFTLIEFGESDLLAKSLAHTLSTYAQPSNCYKSYHTILQSKNYVVDVCLKVGKK